jgi:hypothetical protein
MHSGGVVKVTIASGFMDSRYMVIVSAGNCSRPNLGLMIPWACVVEEWEAENGG